MQRKRNKNNAGFTLIEIMVALSILAISGVALLSTISQATSDLSKLNDKLIALNLAEYSINNILIRQEFPELGSEEEVITLGDREWSVEIEISKTPNEDVRRIDALVKPYQTEQFQKQSATILLSAFMSDIY